MGRRIDVEPDDILQIVRSPDPSNRTDADPDLFGHGGCGPMDGFARLVCLSALHHLIDHRLRQGRDTRWTGLVAQQTVGEVFPPAPACVTIMIGGEAEQDVILAFIRSLERRGRIDAFDILPLTLVKD